ncbi:hypothetical protein HK098_002070 [Nowakowskiella sp. JEL0407]|nr:hypothetical protein HK098_002070 [Nowakowskiella sp. JEL0407]
MSQTTLISRKSSLLSFLILTLCNSHAATLSSLTSQQACANILILPPTASNFTAAYTFSIPNQRFASSSTPPDAIIYPSTTSQVQSAITCSKTAGYDIKIRSGGHSYEALSSTSTKQFIIIDLKNLNSVVVTPSTKRAVVGGGATLGEIYHAIIVASPTLAFPGGVCPTVGIGGLISGGGWGVLGRKYGLAIDHVISFKIVTSSGQLLLCDSKTNPDIFWAVRGGGGGTFGVVVEFTLELVDVPTVLSFGKISSPVSLAADIWTRYQAWITNKNVPNELTTKVYMDNSIISVEVAFLGPRSELTKIAEAGPLAGQITESNVREGSWSDWVLFFGNFKKSGGIELLLDRFYDDRTSFYASSDFIATPLPPAGINTLISALQSGISNGFPYIILDGYANGQATVPASTDTPFHNRKVLFCVQYQALFYSPASATTASIWLKNLQTAMTAYVTGGAYVNYINLQFGTDVPQVKGLSTTVPPPPNWAVKYFGEENWARLVRVKAMVDFEGVFGGPQSIPVVVSKQGELVTNATTGTGGNTSTSTQQSNSNGGRKLELSIGLILTFCCSLILLERL